MVWQRGWLTLMWEHWHPHWNWGITMYETNTMRHLRSREGDKSGRIVIWWKHSSPSTMGPLSGGREGGEKTRWELTSMAWVYCSSLSSILERKTGGCVFLKLLLYPKTKLHVKYKKRFREEKNTFKRSPLATGLWVTEVRPSPKWNIPFPLYLKVQYIDTFPLGKSNWICAAIERVDWILSMAAATSVNAIFQVQMTFADHTETLSQGLPDHQLSKRATQRPNLRHVQ